MDEQFDSISDLQFFDDFDEQAQYERLSGQLVSLSRSGF